MLRIAINGFGRIGRNILRAVYENGYREQVQIVAINDLAPLDINTHLLRFDTTHGRFNASVEHTESGLRVNGDEIQALEERDPAQLPWRDLDIDLVMECTGFFRSREGASKHLAAGAKKVLVSAPGKNQDGVTLDATVVYGVNEDVIKPEHTLVSNGSCTTNCLAHIAKAMHDSVGIESGLANTVHAYTNTQNLLDSYHKDKRRARAAGYSMIPTSTGSAKAIGDVIPELDGKLDAVAVRVPTINVSLLDFTFVPSESTNLDEVMAILARYQTGRETVFRLSEEPLVSVDFNHDAASCVVDVAQTRMSGGLIKIMAWYDNEWGFSNRMLDTALTMGGGTR